MIVKAHIVHATQFEKSDNAHSMLMTKSEFVLCTYTLAYA